MPNSIKISFWITIIALASEVVFLIIVGNIAIYEYDIDKIVYNTQNPTLLYIPCFIISLVSICLIWKHARFFLFFKRKKIFLLAIVILISIAVINFIVPTLGLGYINYKYGSLKKITDGEVQKTETRSGIKFIHVDIENKLIILAIVASKKDYHKEKNKYKFRVTKGLWCSYIITPVYTN